MELKPYQGLGAITFGMPRNEIIVLFGEPHQRFRKVPWSITLTDTYPAFGMHIYFDTSDRVDFIDVFKPCDIKYGGVQLVNRRSKELMADLSIMGIEFTVDKLGFVVDQLGVAMYAPGIEEEGDWVEAVSIFKSREELPKSQ